MEVFLPARLWSFETPQSEHWQFWQFACIGLKLLLRKEFFTSSQQAPGKHVKNGMQVLKGMQRSPAMHWYRINDLHTFKSRLPGRTPCAPSTPATGMRECSSAPSGISRTAGSAQSSWQGPNNLEWGPLVRACEQSWRSTHAHLHLQRAHGWTCLSRYARMSSAAACAWSRTRSTRKRAGVYAQT